MSLPGTASGHQESCHAVRRLQLFGIPIDSLTPEELLNRIRDAAEASDRARVFFCLNANYANLAYGDAQLLHCFQNADTVFADGMGILWGARLMGWRLPAKITVTDFIEPLSEMAAHRGYEVFLLGGQPGRAEEAGRRLRSRYPQLRIVGTHHGMFGAAEESEILRRIREVAPRVLVVGLGAPRQERWLTANRALLPPCAALSGGGVFDFLSGHTPRGPRWLTDRGWEWLCRLVTEPRRLWRRYLLGNPVFLLRVLRARGQWRRGGRYA